MLNAQTATRAGDEAAEFVARLRDATELLESIIADRGLLAGIPAEDRRRLLDAVALVYHPDAAARRQLVKATVRQRKAERVGREERARNETGIRQLRKQTVFTTPNVFPPPAFEPRDIHGEPADTPGPDTGERQH